MGRLHRWRYILARPQGSGRLPIRPLELSGGTAASGCGGSGHGLQTGMSGMASATRTMTLCDQHGTERLARLLAAAAGPGDVVGLSGALGVGKTTLARAFIRARADAAGIDVGDIPSPTFSLVQIYEFAAGDVWHVDLYRLDAPDETLQLGLDDAFAGAITLIEWPDRMGRLAPADRLVIKLDHLPDQGKDARTATLVGYGDWAGRLDGLMVGAVPATTDSGRGR